MAFRRKIWIDSRVQGALIGRAVLYWFAVTLYFGVAFAVSIYCDNPQWTFQKQFAAWFSMIGPWLPSALLILPLVLYDIVRLSHQFVGPVHRARMQLERMVQSPNCTPYSLRTDDYWHELVRPMNGVQNHILSLHVALQKAADAMVAAEPNPPKQPPKEIPEEEQAAQSKPKVVCLEAANLQVLEDSTTAS